MQQQSPHFNTISSDVKTVISEDTNKPKIGIRHRHNLEKVYGYNAPGRAALAPRLNGHFASKGRPIPDGGLKTSKTQAAETVGDLVGMIRTKFEGE